MLFISFEDNWTCLNRQIFFSYLIWSRRSIKISKLYLKTRNSLFLPQNISFQEYSKNLLGFRLNQRQTFTGIHFAEDLTDVRLAHRVCHSTNCKQILHAESMVGILEKIVLVLSLSCSSIVEDTQKDDCFRQNRPTQLWKNMIFL